ncbi:hypothetical protein GH714_017136 [Hevea brasiliensis]|uniref:Uncharacterized protein n=1 Tax=Hevea brasiliensis TaxID=3981 RepID=A0A6A6MAP0_HEVBR|nr:hypothetical protein GH714_017136 [Hevea brasiliensis]
MEDTDVGLSFDFEGGLDVGPTNPTASIPAIPSGNPAAAAAAANNNSAVPAVPAMDPSAPGANQAGRRSFRQTVCRHWLRSLCMKGDACGFLHQYDKSRMPVCRFFRLYGECREQDCVYKHTNEDIKECNMYKLGFCPNGPDCRYRHAKLPGPPPPVEEVLQKIQQLNSYNYGSSNKFFQQRGNGFQQHTDNLSFCKALTAQAQNLPNGQPFRHRTATSLPQGISRYFIVKSCNRENLELSVQQGVWATQRSNEAKLNEAFDSAENVILIFSVNRTRHFQGCAKMTSKIGASAVGGNWKYAHGTAHYGRNFSVKWLKLCELSFHKTRHLRNPYNENLPVKISRDCQELEPSIGEQLASLLYLEPDSELMALGAAGQGRGRGRGIMWPQMPLARGARPIPGMRGPASGMMFPGRPSQPGAMFPTGGFGMMMPGRAPLLGQWAPLPKSTSRPVKRDQRTAANDRNDNTVQGQTKAGVQRGLDDEGQYQQEGIKAAHEDQFGAGTRFRNDESESEDEAPRRSRHGEGKKRSNEVRRRCNPRLITNSTTG